MKKLNLGLLSICTLSLSNLAFAQTVTGNVVIEDGKIRIVGVGINVGPQTPRDHHHHSDERRDPRPPLPQYDNDYMDPREAELIIRSCSSAYQNESQARCYSDNLLRNPSTGFQRIGRAANAGTSYFDRATAARTALEVVSSRRVTNNIGLAAILAGCKSMYQSESKANCFAAGTANSSEAMSAVREGSQSGTSYFDRASSFTAGIEKRLAGNGPISSLKAACEAAYQSESQAKCFQNGGKQLRDFQANVVLIAAASGASYFDRSSGSKNGLGARIENLSMARQILATCKAMYQSESQSNCYAAAGVQMRGFDPTIDRLLRSCQNGNSYFDRARCSENVLRNL